MSRIVAIGGGEIAEAETEPIDRRVCELAAAEVPNVLFVPTASGDAAGYCDAFADYYGGTLDCSVRHLTVYEDDLDADQIRTELAWADVVYVGGGSLPLLLDCWRDQGVDRLLREAYREGTVIAGLSAGATCWFESGLSDSANDAGYEGVECLGWVSGFACTAHATTERRAAFREFLASRPEAGVAIEDGAAIELVDGEYRVHSVSGGESVYSVSRKGGEINVSEVAETYSFRSIESLR